MELAYAWYIKAEKPKTLRDTLKRAKEAEELGTEHDADEDIKGLQDSMSMLLAKLDKPGKASNSIPSQRSSDPVLERNMIKV